MEHDNQIFYFIQITQLYIREREKKKKTMLWGFWVCYFYNLSPKNITGTIKRSSEIKMSSQEKGAKN